MGSKNKQSRNQNKGISISFVIGLAIIGLGIGWLAGLSLSPVISIIVTSVAAAASTLIAVFGGSKETGVTNTEPSSAEYLRKVTPWPLAILVVGIVVGSTSGLFVRTHNFLGVNQRSNSSWMDVNGELSDEIEMWTAVGISKSEIAEKLFEFKYLSNAPSNNDTQKSKGTQGGLYGVTVEECNEIPTMNDSEVLVWMMHTDRSEVLRELSGVIDDGATLKKVSQIVCEFVQ